MKNLIIEPLIAQLPKLFTYLKQTQAIALLTDTSRVFAKTIHLP